MALFVSLSSYSERGGPFDLPKKGGKCPAFSFPTCSMSNRAREKRPAMERVGGGGATCGFLTVSNDSLSPPPIHSLVASAEPTPKAKKPLKVAREGKPLLLLLSPLPPSFSSSFASQTCPLTHTHLLLLLLLLLEQERASGEGFTDKAFLLHLLSNSSTVGTSSSFLAAGCWRICHRPFLATPHA